MSANFVNACRRNVQKKDGRTESQTDTECWHSNLIYSTLNKVIWKISAQYVKARRRKVWKTVYFQYSKSQKGHNSYKNWYELPTLELNLKYSETKTYAKFQLNMSRHVREKCGILCISSILRSKRGVTPTKIDVTQTWYVVRQNKVICKISAQYVKACKRKKRKTVYLQYSEFQKGHYSHKNWRKLMTLELDLNYSKTKSYAKFQLL